MIFIILAMIFGLAYAATFFVMWAYVSNNDEDTAEYYGDDKPILSGQGDVMPIKLLKYAKTLPKGKEKTKVLLMIFLYWGFMLLMVVSMAIVIVPKVLS